jgi:hypothetical protein
MVSRVLAQREMTDNIVVMLGSAQFDLMALQVVAGEFGWAVKVADNLSEAASAQVVLFHRDALGPACSWLEAVRLLRIALPGARLERVEHGAQPRQILWYVRGIDRSSDVSNA